LRDALRLLGRSKSANVEGLWHLERCLVNHFLITDYIELSRMGRDLR
jgi:hypothetical protein